MVEVGGEGVRITFAGWAPGVDRLRFQDEGKGVNLMFMIGDWVEGVKCLGLG